jgi:hypothetical protein
MRLFPIVIAGLLFTADSTVAQLRPPADTDVKLPSGKSQKEEILKEDHEKSLEDAAKLIEMSEDLKMELEKNDRHVLSVGMLKKLDEMEKLVRRIRGRLKRY